MPTNAERQAKWRKKRNELADKAERTEAMRKRVALLQTIRDGDTIDTKAFVGTVGDRVRRDLDIAFAYHKTTHLAWIEATIALAHHLQNARKLFKTDKAFAAWLNDQKFDDRMILRRFLHTLMTRKPENNGSDRFSPIPERPGQA